MQDGSVYARGKQWCGRYRRYTPAGDCIGQLTVALGPRRCMSKKEAQKKLRDVIAKHSVTSAAEAVEASSNTEGNPWDPSNFMDRVIRPAAQRAKISVPATFQVMRRTTATKQQAHGGVERVQEHLRHSTVQTAFNLYVHKVDSDQQRRSTVTGKKCKG